MTAIQTQAITYSSAGTTLNGHLAWDADIKSERPGVLVVHEFWGNNAYAQRRAHMLAELGYTALALDLYGEGATADTPEAASALMNQLLADLPTMRSRFNAALEQLKAHVSVNAKRTAAIGYCLGGGVVLHMARYGADLDAVASFHGSLGLASAAEGEGVDVTARVVAYNGESDPFVPSDAIAAFKAEMDKARADYQLINLPGAVHGFSNPEATGKGEKFGMPLKYNELADQCSWAHMRMLLATEFNSRD